MPKNATDKQLELSIIDDVGVLENPPTTVIAGQPFKLKIKKDADGNAFNDFVVFNKESGYHIIKTEAPNNAELVGNTLSYVDENNVSKSINVSCED